jgi:hypothetical protein
MSPSQDIRLGNIYLNSEAYLAGKIADCDAKLARYRAVLDVGTSLATVAFSMSFFLRVLGQQEHEDEGGRQGDEAHP